MNSIISKEDFIAELIRGSHIIYALRVSEEEYNYFLLLDCMEYNTTQ